MNSSAINIDNLALILGYGLLIIPIAFILHFKIKLQKKLLVALVRMTLQLLFVGLYLQFVFDLNAWWLNILWLIVMLVAADFSLLTASNLRLKKFMLPIFLSLLIGTGLPLVYFIAVVLRLPNILDARYFIPIAGMIMGNSLRADIVGLRAFYSSIHSSEKAFLFFLASGASLNEAIRPYLREAYSASLAPTIATMSTIGLVSLPGMMTGIILGGTDPMVAIKYQIAIMIAIFTGTAMGVMISIMLTVKASFTRLGVLDVNIFNSLEN